MSTVSETKAAEQLTIELSPVCLLKAWWVNTTRAILTRVLWPEIRWCEAGATL